LKAAFYAPLKSPDHPRPSGDRTMARLLLRALKQAGFEPAVASRLRTHDPAGDGGLQARIRDASLAEADWLIAGFRARPETRPALWFTYHCYYKAPDWIGPRVAEALDMPYVVAEGSRAGKRAGGPWALGHAGAEAALDRADAVLVMTEADREALERARPSGQRLVDLPPFLDPGEWPEADGAPRAAAPGEPLRLLAVAMMRPGDKLASYRILADALPRLDPLPWTLDVVGDGEARPEVEALLMPFGDRARLHGRVDGSEALSRLYAGADLFVWPAVNEAYGMVFLEAQAHGLPVAAGRFGGVASVVRHGETGLLAEPGSPEALAEAVRALAGERGRALGRAARRFVARKRGLPAAAAILRGTLAALLAEGVR
jgi:glycosyltransferase involved in cell wall biosynthesis